MWNRKVFIRIVELLLCISCVVALRVTDDESRRVFHYLRNRSREWSLLNNVTWGAIGAAFATATCGGYVIVTLGLLVGAASGELRGRITELFLLGLGVILFGIVGALSLASIDSVPEDLVDNAAVLGALCLLTALVFVVDILMKIPGEKKKHDGTQTNVEKDIVKIPMATLNDEKETKSRNGGESSSESEDKKSAEMTKGSVNTGFDKSESSKELENGKESVTLIGDEENDEENFDLSKNGRNHRGAARGSVKSQDIFEAERNRRFQEVGKQLREYSNNFESGEDNSRESVRYRNNFEDRNNARREYFEGDRLAYNERDNNNSYFRKHQDAVFRRPLDEVDTPLFPTNLENRISEPIFAKIVNPGVKIMRVDRSDFGNNNLQDDNYYRNSDSSQYDNVPTRMRGMSLGILKKNQRDVSFNIPPPPKIFSNVSGSEKQKDEIQKLEECFNSLHTSIGTQTGSQMDVNSPSSPNDPGYVRHTASNWPRDQKSKTPSSSPDHDKK